MSEKFLVKGSLRRQNRPEEILMPMDTLSRLLLLAGAFSVVNLWADGTERVFREFELQMGAQLQRVKQSCSDKEAELVKRVHDIGKRTGQIPLCIVDFDLRTSSREYVSISSCDTLSECRKLIDRVLYLKCAINFVSTKEITHDLSKELLKAEYCLKDESLRVSLVMIQSRAWREKLTASLNGDEKRATKNLKKVTDEIQKFPSTVSIDLFSAILRNNVVSSPVDEVFLKYGLDLSWKELLQIVDIKKCEYETHNRSPYLIAEMDGISSGIISDAGKRQVFEIIFNQVPSPNFQGKPNQVTLRFSYDRVLRNQASFCGFEMFVRSSISGQPPDGYVIDIDGNLLGEVPSFLASDKMKIKVTDRNTPAVKAGVGCYACHAAVSTGYNMPGADEFWSPGDILRSQTRTITAGSIRNFLNGN